MRDFQERKVRLAPQLDDILRTAVAVDGADYGDVQWYEPETSALHLVAAQGFDEEFLTYFAVVADVSTPCGLAAQKGTITILEDTETDPGFAPHRAIAARANFRSARSVPLRAHSGQLLGMLSTHWREPLRARQPWGGASRACADLAANVLEQFNRDPDCRATPALCSEVAGTALAAAFTTTLWSLDRPAGAGIVSIRELPPELARAASHYVRALKMDGAAPENMLRRLKDALRKGDRPLGLPAEQQLATAVVSHAIGEFYRLADTKLPREIRESGPKR